MPLIWTDTFESYTAGASISAPWTGDAHSQILTAQAHGGTKSLAAGQGGFASVCTRPLGSSPSQWYADFWMYTPNVAGGGTIGQYVAFCSTTVSLGNAPRVNVSSAGAGMCGGNLITFFTFSATLNTWHHYIYEVLSGVAGTAKLTLDGAVVGTFSGDTRDATGASFVSNVGVVGQVLGASPAAELFIDDLSVYSGVPTAAGGAAQTYVMVLA